MLISTDILAKAIDTWVQNDLINKGSLVQQGLVTFIYTVGKTKISSLLAPISILGDEKGYLDTEVLHQAASAGLEKMGGAYMVPLINYKMDMSDVEHILHYARESL